MKKKSGVLIGSLVIGSLVLLLLSSFLVLAETSGQETVNIIATPESGEAPLSVTFSAQPAANSYSWDFNGDGTVDSSEADPTFVFNEPGKYIITLTAELEGNTKTATKEISVDSPIALSITATPTAGQAPLTVQFTLAATGRGALKYAWDFNWDKKIDSTEQNPVFTYSSAGEYKAIITVSDSESNTATASIPISVEKYNSHLNLSSYFPDSLNLGEASITLILVNEGTEPVKDITAKLVGNGIQHLTSTSISLLQPGDQDSLTIKANFLKEGELNATIKVLDKNFPLTFSLKKGEAYNKEELQAKFEELKKQLQEQENIYYDKKSDGYLVSEVFDNIKSTQKQLQEVQQQLLTNKLSEAKVGLELTGGAITDLSADLTQVRKQKVTLLMWMKENAVAITAIIASLGALGGILVKVKTHAVKMKDQAQKFVQEGAQKISEKIEEGKKKKNGNGWKKEEKDNAKKEGSDESSQNSEEKV